MSFVPLGDRVAVELIQQDDKTVGGIIIPDTAKEKPVKGKIIAIGKGVRDDKGNFISMQVKVGDVVLFGKWAGTEVKVDGHELMVMKESDIIGIME